MIFLSDVLLHFKKKYNLLIFNFELGVDTDALLLAGLLVDGALLQGRTLQVTGVRPAARLTVWPEQNQSLDQRTFGIVGNRKKACRGGYWGGRPQLGPQLEPGEGSKENIYCRHSNLTH